MRLFSQDLNRSGHQSPNSDFLFVGLWPLHKGLYSHVNSDLTKWTWPEISGGVELWCSSVRLNLGSDARRTIASTSGQISWHSMIAAIQRQRGGVQRQQLHSFVGEVRVDRGSRQRVFYFFSRPMPYVNIIEWLSEGLSCLTCFT